MSAWFAPIVEAFFPNARQVQVTPIGAGLINDTYQLVLEGHPAYILQRINTTVFRDGPALMRNHEAIAQHLLNQQDYPLEVPVPVRAQDGAAFFQTLDNECWRVMPFIEKTYAPAQLPAPEAAFEAARAYGLFLSALSNFDPKSLYEPLPGFHDTLQRYAVWEKALSEDTHARAATCPDAVAAVTEAKKYALQVADLLKTGALPIRTVHNDTKAGNVLLYEDTGKAAAVIDWDTIMPGSLISDYGDMVRTFVPSVGEDGAAGEVSLRTDVLRALNEGFLSAVQPFITPVERQHLYLGALWIVGEQALRFLTDYIRGDVYYKIKYAHHNLDRAYNQLALLRVLKQRKNGLFF